MKCSSCGNEFGNGANCQNCGVDKVTGLGKYIGFSAPESKDKQPQEPIPQSQMAGNKICPFCQEIIPSYADYCPFCSKKLEEICPKCGHVYSAHFPACPKCGTNRERFLKAKLEREERQRQEEVMKRQEEERLKQEKERREREETQRKKEQLKLDFEKWSEINNHYLKLRKQYGKRWWKTENGAAWLRTAEAEFWLKDDLTEFGDDSDSALKVIWEYYYFIRKDNGRQYCRWLNGWQGEHWLKTMDGRNFVVRNYLFLEHPFVWFEWMNTEQGKKWVASKNWLKSKDCEKWQNRIIDNYNQFDSPTFNSFINPLCVIFIIISILGGFYSNYLITGFSYSSISDSIGTISFSISFPVVIFLILSTILFLIRILIREVWWLKWRKWLRKKYNVSFFPWDIF